MAKILRYPASVRFCALALALSAAVIACGGSSTSPTISTGGGGGVTVNSASTGTTGPIGATVTMTSAGVSPATVTITVGQSVTFVNNDTRTHDIGSDPHPQHGSCPSIENGVSTIAPGQQKSTQGFAGAGTCTYHDHLDPTNANFQGTIRIQ